MNIILLGPQGSGKGTQAELLAEKLNLKHLEMGRILRSIAASDNEYAPVVKQTMEKGELVPDEYTRLIAWDFINKHKDEAQGFVLEGYPRSLAQYEHVEDMFMKFGKKIDWVIVIDISEDESIKRLSARLTCEKCGRVYNTITNPPPGKTCECGGNFVQREDDKPEAIKRRLQIYHTQTQEIIAKAKTEGVLLEVNGERPIEVINEDIFSRIKE